MKFQKAALKTAAREDPAFALALGAFVTLGLLGASGLVNWGWPLIAAALAAALGAAARLLRAGAEGAKPPPAAPPAAKSGRQTAALACRGARKSAPDRYEYSGLRDCRAAALLHDGPKACRHGCLGLGSCLAACPAGALALGDGGIPEIAAELCTACGRCAAVCPRRLYSLAGEKQVIRVACASRDSGKESGGACAVGCIACRRCEKACKFQAITVLDNLAAIDYARCRSCGSCLKSCPRGAIVDLAARSRAEEAAVR